MRVIKNVVVKISSAVMYDVIQRFYFFRAPLWPSSKFTPIRVWKIM